MDLLQNWPAILVLIALVTLVLITQLFYLRQFQRAARLNHTKGAGSKTKPDIPRTFEQIEHAHKAQLQQTITELKATQTKLQNTQDYLNSIINSMPSILIGVNRSGDITHWNSSATLATDLLPHQALGQTLTSLPSWIPITKADIETTITTGQPKQMRNQADIHGRVSYQNVTIYPLISSSTEGVVIRIDDLSHQVQLETMMMQNSKLISLGELSANLVHELNNPLAAITQNNQTLKRRMLSDEASNQDLARSLGLNWEALQDYLNQRGIEKMLSATDEAGQRAATLVKNMLNYARTMPDEHQPTDINLLINDTLNILSSTLDSTIIDRQLEAKPLMAKINGAEIQQVLINLLQNAVQAVEGLPHPLISISTRQNGDQVSISVRDNGPGISPEAIDKIFDPFYTTKAQGQGTGLGLSISHYIVTEQHGGNLSVCSTPSNGTEFLIDLPASSSEQSKKEMTTRQVECA